VLTSQLSEQCNQQPTAQRKKEYVDQCRHEIAGERKGQRREPAADDVRFVSERTGWLPFAGPSCSARSSW
jgi:hypothetical protein